MKTLSSRALASALSLAALTSCDRHATREAFGQLVLEKSSWTIPGPCPKHESASRLYGPDGELLFEHARFKGSSPDKVWSLWYGGEHEDMFAIDHRTNTRVAITWSNRAAPDWWSPTAHRVALIRSGNPRDRLMVVDLSSGKAETSMQWYSDDSVEQLSWSPQGDSIAVLTDRSRAEEPRAQLIHIRSFAPVEAAPIEERNEPPSYFAIVWADGRPRLERRR